MLHTLRFSLQNAVYFIMPPLLVSVLFTFYIQVVLKFKCKTLVPKGYTGFVQIYTSIIQSLWAAKCGGKVLEEGLSTLMTAFQKVPCNDWFTS
jgi:hypothetical protein